MKSLAGGRKSPTLFTRMSIRESSTARAVSVTSATVSRSRMSPTTDVARSRAAVIVSWVGEAASELMAASTTCAPAAASRWLMPPPIPSAPPVTIATWPENRTPTAYSVHVADVALGRHQLTLVIVGVVFRHRAVPSNDRGQRGVDVLRHPGRVPAHIEVRALVEPPPHVGAVVEHLVLDIDPVGLVAGERQIQPVEEAVADHVLQIVAVVEVFAAVLVAEEQPVAAGLAERASLLQKAAKRRDAGAGADHDHRCPAVLGRTEMRRALQEHRRGGGSVGQERRAHPAALATVGAAVAHHRYGHLHLVLADQRAPGDPVAPRLH